VEAPKGVEAFTEQFALDYPTVDLFQLAQAMANGFSHSSSSA
jgi:hypothetical protein